MNRESKALKRLGIAGLTAVTAVGVTPFLGVVAANAVAPPAAALTFTTPTTQSSSYESDGTNTTVKLEVVVNNNNNPTSPSGQLPTGDGVQFSEAPVSNGNVGATVIIGTDYTAPYSIEWAAPQANQTYNLYATVVNSAGNPESTSPTSANYTYSSPAEDTTTVSGLPAVHITSPADGTQVGEGAPLSGPNTASGSTPAGGGGYISVSGTRSAELPEIDVTVTTRNEMTGVSSTAIYGQNVGGNESSFAPGTGTVPAGTAANGGTQNWSTTVKVPNCPQDNSTSTSPGSTGISSTNSGCDVIVHAVTNTTPATDDSTVATLYQQTGGQLAVASPSAQTEPASSTPNANYTVTLTDQKGNPIAGATVTGTVESGTSAEIEGTGTSNAASSSAAPASYGTAGKTATSTTNAQGQAFFGAFDPVAGETSYFDFSSGSLTLTKGASLTTYSQTVTGAALSATPMKDLYAEQTEYTGYNSTVTTAGSSAAPTGAAPSTANTFPLVELCLTDQNGNATNNTGQAPIVTDTRTVQGGTPGTPMQEAVTPENNSTAYGTAPGKGNCYVVNYPAPTGTYGSDTFNAYFERNGQNGYQPPTPGASNNDLEAAPLTLNYANLQILATNTQGQKGQNVSGSFTVQGVNGAPFAGRQITLSLTSTNNQATFSTTQPSDNKTSTNTSSVCTTDANGVCSYSVTEPSNTNSANDTASVTATDNITNKTQKATGVSTTSPETVTFSNTAPSLTSVQQVSEKTYGPDTAGANANNAGVSGGAGEPGEVEVYTYQLNSGTTGSPSALSGVPVTVTTDHGFFTPLPKSGTTTYQSFASPAPSDKGTAGGVTNGGQTFTGTTDNNGQVTFALSIARDAAFDQTGNVISTLKFTSGGASQSVQAAPSTSAGTVNGNTASSTNPTFSTDSDNSGQEPLNGSAVQLVSPDTTTKPSTTSQSNYQSNSTSNQGGGVAFQTHLLDQFGNLVRDNINKATLTVTGPATLYGPATDPGEYLTDTTDIHYLDNNATSTTASNATVTATWNAPSTTYTGTTTGTGSNAVTTYSAATTDNSTSPKTDSFTVSEYKTDLSNLHYTFTTNPPSGIVPTGTAVTDKVVVTDQNGNPVQGLTVVFYRSGPSNQTDTSQAQKTGPDGSASYVFTSAVQGTATITVVVSDPTSGNEYSRAVNTVSFDGVPTMNEVASRRGAGTVAITGVTRPGALVQLFQEPYGATSYTYYNGGQERADGNGNYAFYPTISKETSFRVLIDPTSGDYSGNSAVVTGPHRTTTVSVLPTLTLRSLKKGTVVAYIHYSPSLNSGAKTVIDLLTSHGYVYKATTYGTTVTFAATPGRTQQFVAFTTSNVAGVLNGQSQTYTIRIHS
jgi:hypothetical protein